MALTPEDLEEIKGIVKKVVANEVTALETDVTRSLGRLQAKMNLRFDLLELKLDAMSKQLDNIELDVARLERRK